MDSNSYPDGNPKSVHGEAKPGIHCVPPVFILQLGQAMAEGKRKYGYMNWRDNKVDLHVYYNASQRHMMAWLDGETLDPATGIPHLALAGACLAIMQDAAAHGAAIDMRVAGPAPSYIAEHTVAKPLLEPIPAATIDRRAEGPAPVYSAKHTVTVTKPCPEPVPLVTQTCHGCEDRDTCEFQGFCAREYRK